MQQYFIINHQSSIVNRQSSIVRLLSSALYICREPSTNQLLFMQNKPNVKDAQINVTSYMKSKYEKLDTWLSGKNKPNSNPIAERVKMMQSRYLQRIMKKNAYMGYKKTKPKQTQFPQRAKLMQSLYLQRIMKINADMGSEKTNPNKPNLVRRRRIANAHKPIKGAGRKKGLRNFFWLSVAGKDILLFMGNPG